MSEYVSAPIGRGRAKGDGLRIWKTVVAAVVALVVTALGMPAAGATAPEQPGTVRLAFRVTAGASVDAPGPVVDTVAAIGMRVVEVPAGRAAAALAALRRAPGVAWAEEEVRFAATATVPDDPLWPRQWGAARIGLPAAWDTTTGSAGTVIAVLDSGVRASHPDLAGAVLPGRDFVNGDADADDDNGHGTAVAGVAAARGNNGLAIAGACWTCRILPVKVLAHDGWGSSNDIAAGLTWAADNGAKVANLSFGGTSPSSAVANAVAYARSKGVVVIGAAGNEASTTPTYPANNTGVVSVAASTSTDARYSWSNHGSWVDLAAPGCHESLTTSGGTSGACGTSFSAPMTAGVAALALAAGASPASVEQALLTTGPSLSYVAGGRLDAPAVLASAVAAPAPDPAPTSDPAPAPAPTGGSTGTLPGAPGNVQAEPRAAAAAVSWSAASGDGITGYVVEASPGGRTVTVPGTARSAVVDGLENGTAYRFVVRATNAAGTGAASKQTSPVTPSLDGSERVAGAGRVATAVAASARAFPSAPAVVVARADAYADALAAAPLAARLGGPVLLSPSTGLPAEVAAEVRRLGATTAVLVGGTAALHPAVEDGLRGAGATAVTRVAGTNRFDTAARIADEVGGTSVVVVEGANADPARGWPDAVAASGYAAATGRPILLVTAAGVPAETSAVLSRLGATAATVVGGTAAVPEHVAAALGVPVTRLAGPDRYATSVAVADAAVQAGAKAGRAWVATGRDWPDALAGGPAVAKRRGVLLLVDGTDPTRSPVTADWLRQRRPVLEELVLVGGSGSVSPATETYLESNAS